MTASECRKEIRASEYERGRIAGRREAFEEAADMARGFADYTRGLKPGDYGIVDPQGETFRAESIAAALDEKAKE